MTDVTVKDQRAISLLKAEVQAFILFRDSIEQRIKRDCALRGQAYNGLRSWPESLRVWRDKKRKTLIAFAQSMGLCRKHIKQAVIELEQLEPPKSK